ncbi:MAG TPA: CoA transferase [Gaiellaceae bacterium]|jgi:crotonobetainyl-CoA:carnitine CoA-transferase CaiB-like acyl-CoA transferase
MDILRGRRVVDVTASLAGPYCTQLLAAFGADVVKVEPPGGDHARAWGPPFVDGAGALWFAANAGKRSVVLDLVRDRERLLELVDDADVFVQSLRPGLAEERGLDAATLRARRPELIHVSIGAYASRPGYDPLLQAASGIMSVTGEADGPPVRVGVSLIDFATGQWAAIGVLAALLRGGGATIEASLYETALALLAGHVAGFAATGEEPGRHGSAFPLIAPYEVFAGDLMIAAGSDALWERLRGALGLPDDPRLRTNPDRVANRDALRAAIEAALAGRPTDEWERVLIDAGVPAARVRTVAEAYADPETEALGILQRLGGGVTVAPPLRIDGERPLYPSTPPALGS